MKMTANNSLRPERAEDLQLVFECKYKNKRAVKNEFDCHISLSNL